MRRTFLANNPLCMGPDSQCERHGRITPATIRDHRIPLAEGGSDDADNEQALCVACHDIKSAAEAQRGVHREFATSARITPDAVASNIPDDIATPCIPVTIVTGTAEAAAAHVAQSMNVGDVVIHIDRIVSAMARQPLRHTDREARRWLPLALEARNDLLRSLAVERTARHAWFIVGDMDDERRDRWQRRLAADVVKV